jgi:integrase
MKAIEGLENPCQRTALLLVRWSGARKGEIRRLAIDCLDAYPDGYPRLRIPVGKTYTERMVPLHPQAAEALRELIELAKAAAPAARFDTWAQQPVRWVFMHRGQPMGKRYLFDEPLEIACQAAGLLDARGRPTVSAHRFRHTVGTQPVPKAGRRSRPSWRSSATEARRCRRRTPTSATRCCGSSTRR